MLGVLSSPRLDDLEVAIVSLDRESELQHVVARLDHSQNTADLLSLVFWRVARLALLHHLVLDDAGGAVEEHLNHLEERNVPLGRICARVRLRNEQK